MSRRRSKADQPVADQPHPGTLYVVATPLGNLEDITLRALRVLKEVALIACEDTRHTRKLLTHYEIKAPLLSYYREREAERTSLIMERLRRGEDIALVSDAGTPGISDPGRLLVRAAHAGRIPVVPIPGASAPATMISVADLAADSFLFLGFPPARRQERRTFWAGAAREQWPLVFFETPHRIVSCLADCLEFLGDRPIFLARELTKIHEEFLRGTISEVQAELADRSTVKGELVGMIAGAPPVASPGPEEVRAVLRGLHAQGQSLRQAVDQVAQELAIPRSPIYREALKIWSPE